jgi:hypothetical protein
LTSYHATPWMSSLPRSADSGTLRRFARYAERRFDLSALLYSVRDQRRWQTVRSVTVATCIFFMMLCRMGSLNQLEKSRGMRFWRRQIDGRFPSADTIGRVACTSDTSPLRGALRHLYKELKRGKVLHSAFHLSLLSLILDGHECFCSYRRHCRDCLERTIKQADGPTRVQYYHRHVTAVLMCERFSLLLDMEMQKPKEGEVSCAMRLFKRLMENYPRAFDIVSADGLYAQKPFIKLVRKHHKHCLVVLKDDRRDLMQQAHRQFAKVNPTVVQSGGKVQRRIWDAEIRARWAETDICIRVVRSHEVSYVRRQLTKQKEAKCTEWIWACTLSKQQLPTEALVYAGHRRWDIENHCFNELVNTWHADHTYRHDATAITVFWLFAMIVYNIFHAFYWLNLKQPIRDELDKIDIAKQIEADFRVTNPRLRLNDP